MRNCTSPAKMASANGWCPQGNGVVGGAKRDSNGCLNRRHGKHVTVSIQVLYEGYLYHKGQLADGLIDSSVQNYTWQAA